ncbi:MAG TPA: EAL domain-containing protein [Burkholderiales bacterium]|nr:EAL domain-containing protein [Burkholderiales bacterium]
MEKNELRLLLVEDMPTDAELEVRELKRAGMRIVHRIVETEESFRAALNEFFPHLIISDFSMPHFDGMWALSLSRELAPEIPFIFVSGTIGEEYAIRALKNGATDYVLKSNLVRLPAAVERALLDNQERAARRKAEQELEETRSRLDSIVSSLSDVVWSVSPKPYRMLYVSRAIEALWRRPVQAFYDNPDIWFEAIHPEDRDQVERAWRAALRGGVFDAMYRIVHESSPVRWIHDRARSIRDDAGNVVRLDGIARDITELKLQEQRIARLSRIHAVLSGINSAIVRIRDRQQLLEEACRIAVDHGGFGIAWIGMLDPKSLAISPVAIAGVEAESLIAKSPNTASPDTPLGLGIVGRAVREGRAMFSNDLQAEDGYGGPRRQEALRRGYRSLISLPLMVENAAVGSLSLFAKEPNFFDDEEIKLLAELADDISFALENIARQQQLEKLSRIRAVSSEINAAIVRVRERRALLEETCRIAAEQGKFEMIWIGAVDQVRQDIQPVAWTGFSEEAARRVSWKSMTAAQGTLGEAIATRQASVRNDIEAELPTGGMRGEALRRGCRSTVCLPLVVDEQTVALVALFAAGKDFFDDDELRLLNEVAADISLALQSIAHQEKVTYLSYHDALTGLPNRDQFHERVSQALEAERENGGQAALLMLDLQRFGIVNDTYGRQAGDTLLKLVAERLENVLMSREGLARADADTFAIMLRDVKHAADVAHALEEGLLKCVKQPFPLGGGELRITAQAGIALFPADGADAETLLRNADAALKKAKDAGDEYLFYAPQMNASVAEQMKLENDLRNALLEEQYVLHYQPKFDLANGKMVGMEALIRWNHPSRGMVSPAEFIPLLEETGMILDVGRWALKRAAIEHAAWSAQGLLPPRIAVNVSPAQLRRKDFVDYVKEALASVAKAGERIDIEITESMLMEDVEGGIAKLKAMRELGINVAVDDFGTGYSSLSYLARLPITSLKIDRSFVIQMPKSPEQMAIVSTVISLARALNLKVVAEGVETEEQANLLRLLRCDEVQGYLFGRPVPAAELEKLLRAG